MPRTTRSYGALHFEDLDPKRFEDWVRQLAYDYRPWRNLEATGRAAFMAIAKAVNADAVELFRQAMR
jgi:hypothetical protein